MAPAAGSGASEGKRGVPRDPSWVVRGRSGEGIDEGAQTVPLVYQGS